MNAFLRTGIIFLLLVVASSAGCIKLIQHAGSGVNDTQPVSPETSSITTQPTVITPSSPLATIPPNQSPANVSTVVLATPPETISVNEVNPNPYITPDPYRLAYRNLSNRYTDANLVPTDLAPRIPQFTRKIVLRSNSTAFQVNVTKGPLIIDMTYSPMFTNPDKTSLEGTNSFVSSNAEVTVFEGKVPVAKEGYNGIYSVETHKKITIYSTGSYVVAITGNFVDVTMAIITGSAPEPATPAPAVETAETVDWEEN